ncbi:MAG: mono/diheme cytochrome c family protein, partial [Pseudohongiellaceae bacterium]
GPDDEELRPGPVRAASRPVFDHRALGVGDLLSDFSFTDALGVTGQLSELLDGQLLVLAVRDASCPVSKRYAPRLAALEQSYAERGVSFAYVDCSPQDAPSEVLTSAKKQGLLGRQLVDPEGHLARLLKLRSTTEVLVIDRARTLHYRGAVDDQYGIGFTRDAAQQHWLADAIDAVLAAYKPAVSATTAVGCLLPFDDVTTETSESPPPTWHGDISRVMQNSCVSCHRSGGVGPFPLDDYEAVRGRKGMVRYVVEDHIMPPWGATSGGPWRNDRSLSDADRQLLFGWISAGAPEGDPADAVLPRSWPAEWTLGEPDAVYAGRKINVPAEGTVPYQYYYVKTDLPEDRWVQGIEILPGAAQQVHHVLVFLEDPPAGQENRVSTRGDGGTFGYYAGYIPGQGGRDFGPGKAKLLPAGAWLKFQVHYTSNGEATTDTTRIGFQFAPGKPLHEVRTNAVAKENFEIPPHADNVIVRSQEWISKDATLSGFSPHMHLRGKAFRYELEYPDGRRDVLLDIPAYDFNWQTMYLLAEPLPVPAGSNLYVTAWFDNSENNPANPDPAATVYFGEQTWDEMMIGYFEWWRD